MGIEETSTPPSPEGRENLPSEIRMNGTAMANSPSRRAGSDRRRMAPTIWRALPYS